MRAASLVSVALCATLSSLSAHAAQQAAASAEAYPVKPVRVIVGLAPGGGADIMAREAAQRLTESLGRSFIVDNRPAAGGALAGEVTARAAPDGYTLLLGSASMGVSAATHGAKLPYDAVKDFAPIILMASSPVVLVAHPGLPAKNARELIALAKSRPGKLTFASSGVGGSTHLVAELFNMVAGISLLHIPYKGSGPAMTDIMAGNVDLLFAGAISVVPPIKQQRLKALVVTSHKRTPALPDVPTVSESGLAGAESYSYWGLMAPAATPRPIIMKLNNELNRIIQTQQFRDRLAADGTDAEGGTPERFGEVFRDAIAKWQKVVKHAKIRIE